MDKPLAFVIEDDPDSASFMAQTLEAAIYETRIVYDGQVALELLAEQAPSLVLLDIHLPHVTGGEVLQKIRSDSRLARTWVVVITADAGTTTGRMNDQADFVFIKPISYDQLYHLATRLHRQVR